MKRLLIPAIAAFGAALVLTGGIQAGNGATTQHAALPSSWNGFPMTCDETQVINKNQRKETFRCDFTGPAPTQAVHADETNSVWFSDFDGAPATAFSIVITPSGNLNGTATY
jgi:hypothetical protein